VYLAHTKKGEKRISQNASAEKKLYRMLKTEENARKIRGKKNNKLKASTATLSFSRSDEYTLLHYTTHCCV
jgi:hypothetical protein